MRLSRFNSRLFLAFFAASSLPFLLASKTFVKPAAMHAKAYPAHDNHDDERVTIAADPYDNSEKRKIFSINFEQAGILPIFFVVTNDGDQPVSLANIEITLITGNHSKLTPIASEDIFRRITNPQAATRPSPIPIPRSKVKGTVGPKERDEIESSQFAAKAVEPHGSQSGFLFFDVAGISSPLSQANIDVTGVADAKGHEMLYFEIPMDNYLSAPARR
jgi:hypothetical protein